jgi:hypothetical protein
VRRTLGAGALLLLLAGCGARPQLAVGVSSGPTIHYLLCAGERVTEVRLTAPGGRVLWELRGRSRRTTYRVGVVPPGFRRVVRFRGLGRRATVVSGPDGKPELAFTTPPASGILRGDGVRVSAAAFAAGRSSYCSARRQDRAASLAIGFAFFALVFLFATRWLRGRRSGDPFRRPWRK